MHATFYSAMLVLFVLCQINSLGAVQYLKDSYWDVRNAFKQFESEFGRSYEGREARERLKNFRKNYLEVMEHNKLRDPDYYLEINTFSDLNEDEKNSYLGLANFTEIVSELTEEDHAVIKKRSTEPLEVDHRADGLVTPVKNQLNCGSCWAFSGIGAIEGAYKQTTGYLKSFSEQELVDCYYKDTSTRNACSGGTQRNGFIYAKYKKRLATYNDYRYTGVDGTCDKENLPENAIKNARVTGYKWILTNSDSEVQTAASSRILSVAVHASSMFAYRSGIFTGCPDSTKSAVVNHAMIITGYTPKAWILKNSWGVSWGENGYIRIGRDYSLSDCRVTKWVVYPIMKYQDMGQDDKDDIHAEQDDEDVAVTGIAEQRTTFDSLGAASNAIDGVLNGNYSSGTCSKSQEDYINWWTVKFNVTHTVQTVKIHLQRDDDASLGDIDGATLHVGNRGDYLDPVCGNGIDSSMHVDHVITLDCKNLVGRYLTVDWYFANHPDRERRSLTLCEVEIFAHDNDSGCPGGNVRCTDGLCKPPSFC
ncbi:uncharacterized protein LOC134811117 isoform X1 [Bolinopsis microptera]|uniref:uncharacterized protein LOC134811117 isoform X1 n=1 Tax=Bolinopsis microptera TaxID=2820187 RepID=UPI0030790D4C